MTLPHVKVCCIQNEDEAWLAIRHGASALGFVSEMPSGPGVLSESRIAEIVAVLPPDVGVFLLTSKRSPADIIAQQRRCRPNTLQLCDAVDPEMYRELRLAMPGTAIVQVIHVTGEEALAEAITRAPHVNALLLDSGRPNAATPELGGTGRVHDWSVSRKIARECGVPVFLAGGLNPDNVAAAVKEVQPYAVDVCSGLRSDGALDESRLRSFMANVRD